MKSLNPSLAFAFALTVLGGTASAAELMADAAPMQQVSDAEEVDGSSVLIRNDDGIAVTANTRHLKRNRPYTMWWVIFNNPEKCDASCGCGINDLANPDVEAGVFWATGRVTDRYGAATFTAETRVGEIPGGDDQVMEPFINPLLDSHDAEVHTVIRSHGKLRRGKLEQQLTTLNGGCRVECTDVQFSIHPSPTCKPVS
ncbi:MAG: hypothetical protein AAF637_24145 [Pseudomonadota bacterium]